MGDPQMALRDEDVQRLVESAKPWLTQTVESTVRTAVLELLPRPNPGFEKELLERSIRSEQELKAQRELMEARFNASDQRFDSLIREMDQRFESLMREMDQRFDAQGIRFEDLSQEMNLRFEETRARDRRTDWFMALGFTIVTVAVTLVGVLL